MNTDKMLKKMLGSKGKSKLGAMPKMGTGMPKLKMPLMGMNMGLKPMKGASMKMQNTWKNMTPNQKNNMRKIYKDTDHDRVPDRFDCQPRNRFKQDGDIPFEKREFLMNDDASDGDTTWTQEDEQSVEGVTTGQDIINYVEEDEEEYGNDLVIAGKLKVGEVGSLPSTGYPVTATKFKRVK